MEAIKRVIRHNTYKKIYRVVTHSSLVDVTEDHSLLDENLKQIKPNELIIGETKLYCRPIDNKKTFSIIRSVELLHNNYNGYVYDLETEAGTFQAGIGNLILKNTDSNFINYGIIDKETGSVLRDKKGLELSIELANLTQSLISRELPYPHVWAYEKTFLPFLITSKKRYLGMLYENDINSCYLKVMGLELKEEIIQI